MPDRKKVINGLREMSCRATWKDIDRIRDKFQPIINDAIDLLQEQKKAKVVFGRCKDGSFATECGNCGMYLDKAYSICPKCNKELDWNSNQN